MSSRDRAVSKGIGRGSKRAEADHAIVRAIRSKQCAKVQSILDGWKGNEEEGASVTAFLNCPFTKYGANALQLCVNTGNRKMEELAVASLLLDNGADPNGCYAQTAPLLIVIETHVRLTRYPPMSTAGMCYCKQTNTQTVCYFV